MVKHDGAIDIRIKGIRVQISRAGQQDSPAHSREFVLFLSVCGHKMDS